MNKNNSKYKWGFVVLKDDSIDEKKGVVGCERI